MIENRPFPIPLKMNIPLVSEVLISIRYELSTISQKLITVWLTDRTWRLLLQIKYNLYLSFQLKKFKPCHSNNFFFSRKIVHKKKKYLYFLSSKNQLVDSYANLGHTLGNYLGMAAQRTQHIL